MTTEAITPLRQSIIEDMNARKLCAGTQRGHIRSCKRFAAFAPKRPAAWLHACHRFCAIFPLNAATPPVNSAISVGPCGRAAKQPDGLAPCLIGSHPLPLLRLTA